MLSGASSLNPSRYLYIDLVDEITQVQFIGAVERISENSLLPVLEAPLKDRPFVIRGFHSDNGSEYINKRVATLLAKLRIQEFAKSRARRTNDDALVESKNGSMARKHFGYAHIPSRFATKVNAFTQQILSPYLDFHRPCFFPIEVINAKGRIRKRYPCERMMTPCDKLKSLPEAEQYLKTGVAFEQLGAIAYAISDNDAAHHLNQARAELFMYVLINNSQKSVA
uniref:Integrase core domain-containing protein n=1 Tax=Candidatus Kentrum sp. TC TaxID=2126339 RepID=A0A451A7L9_9GAMM|nr:MAG: hypothetical protein BECKTC1821F_GA0114240_10678 [Candidatus Kentron sp. TC]